MSSNGVAGAKTTCGYWWWWAGALQTPQIHKPHCGVCVPASPGGTGKASGTAANNFFLQRLFVNPLRARPPTMAHAYELWALGVAWNR